MNTDFNSLWVEKYRPKDIASFIVTEPTEKLLRLIKTLKKYLTYFLLAHPGSVKPH